MPTFFQVLSKYNSNSCTAINTGWGIDSLLSPSTPVAYFSQTTQKLRVTLDPLLTDPSKGIHQVPWLTQWDTNRDSGWDSVAQACDQCIYAKMWFSKDFSLNKWPAAIVIESILVTMQVSEWYDKLHVFMCSSMQWTTSTAVEVPFFLNIPREKLCNVQVIGLIKCMVHVT